MYDHVSPREARWGLICLLGGTVGAVGAFLAFDWLSSILRGEQMMTTFVIDLLGSVPDLLGDLLGGIFSWEFGGYVLAAVLLVVAAAFGIMALGGLAYVLTAHEQRRDERRRAKHNPEVRDEGSRPDGEQANQKHSGGHRR